MTVFQAITVFVTAFALLRFLVALTNFLSRPFLPNAEPINSPLVSLLIPARNEEKNIGKLLQSLTKQEYNNIEILVYDDLSTDQTPTIIKEFQQTDPRIQIIDGVALPSGWLGKNHACYNLALKATGRYLLFLDADVDISPNFVQNAVAYMQKKQLSLLTMFPKQRMETFGEQMVVPNMNLILLSLLPLWLVSWSRRPSLSAANGQMMMFRANDYTMYQWHKMLKTTTAEDIAISRQIKRHRLRMATLLGKSDISCRMYENYTDSIQGFTKNVLAYFGGSVFFMLFYVAITTLSPLWLFFTTSTLFFTGYLLVVLATRALIASVSEQNVLKSVLFSPLQQWAFLRIVWNALVWKTGKSIRWKGREIQKEK
jgi:glycosyltransferase involved in cell wall biosynthesis